MSRREPGQAVEIATTRGTTRGNLLPAVPPHERLTVEVHRGRRTLLARQLGGHDARHGARRDQRRVWTWVRSPPAAPATPSTAHEPARGHPASWACLAGRGRPARHSPLASRFKCRYIVRQPELLLPDRPPGPPTHSLTPCCQGLLPYMCQLKCSADGVCYIQAHISVRSVQRCSLSDDARRRSEERGRHDGAT